MTLVKLRLAFGLSGLILLASCANLDSVREFGKTAAQITSYPDAGLAFESSARLTTPYRATVPVPADRPEVRHAQVERALKVQAALSGYFATLAKLSGEDSFTLDAELDAIGKGLEGLQDSVNSLEVQAALSLTKIAVKYVLAQKQANAVKALVHEAGPHADKVMAALINVSESWRRSAGNDKSVSTSTLDLLSAGKDSAPLSSLLAKDRLAHLNAEYDDLIIRISTAQAAITKVKMAHGAMETTVDTLPARQWGTLLKAAVADLKTARKDIEMLH